MKINREEIEPGKWEYADEDAAFVLCALPEFYISNIDDFIEGRQKVIKRDAHGDRVEGENVVLGEEVIDYLLEIRSEAFAAYQAKDFPLMLAKLGQLEAQCNWRGLAFATRSIVADDYSFRASQSERASQPRPIARSVRDGRALFASELIASIAPSKVLVPRIDDETRKGLWQAFFDLLVDEELDPVPIETESNEPLAVEFNTNPIKAKKRDEYEDADDPERACYMFSTFKKEISKARK